jgi:hypothetical protein
MATWDEVLNEDFCLDEGGAAVFIATTTPLG